MFLRQVNVDESLMHSKGIVDLALFSSGIHIFTLKVLLLSSENMASMDESKGRNTTSLRAWSLLKTQHNNQWIIWFIKVSHLQQLTQTICSVYFGVHVFVYVLSLMGMSDCETIILWAVHDSKRISHVLCLCLRCHAYIAGFRNSGVLGGSDKRNLWKPFQTQ